MKQYIRLITIFLILSLMLTSCKKQKSMIDSPSSTDEVIVNQEQVSKTQAEEETGKLSEKEEENKVLENPSAIEEFITFLNFPKDKPVKEVFTLVYENVLNWYRLSASESASVFAYSFIDFKGDDQIPELLIVDKNYEGDNTKLIIYTYNVLENKLMSYEHPISVKSDDDLTELLFAIDQGEGIIYYEKNEEKSSLTEYHLYIFEDTLEYKITDEHILEKAEEANEITWYDIDDNAAFEQLDNLQTMTFNSIETAKIEREGQIQIEKEEKQNVYEAYMDVLINYNDNEIQQVAEPITHRDAITYTLFDINQDNIPELLFKQAKTKGLENVYIYYYDITTQQAVLSNCYSTIGGTLDGYRGFMHSENGKDLLLTSGDANTLKYTTEKIQFVDGEIVKIEEDDSGVKRCGLIHKRIVP